MKAMVTSGNDLHWTRGKYGRLFENITSILLDLLHIQRKMTPTQDCGNSSILASAHMVHLILYSDSYFQKINQNTRQVSPYFILLQF